MSSYDVFAERFARLLAEIPQDTPLAQTQQMYSHAIVSMGLFIANRFTEEAAIGPGDPISDASSGGYPRPLPHINSLVLARFVFAIKGPAESS
jgi:hypothetical protein